MRTLTTTPVPTDQTATLVAPWPELEKAGLDPDILDRAKDFAKLPGISDEAKITFLAIVGDGFKERFDPNRFRPAPGDARFTEKNNLLDAIAEAATRFEIDGPVVKTRVPVSVWNAYAFSAMQDYSTMRADAPGENTQVRVASFHAATLTTEFHEAVNAATSAKAGKIIHHASCCSCCTHEAEVKFNFPKHRIEDVSVILFEHICAEYCLETLGIREKIGFSK